MIVNSLRQADSLDKTVQDIIDEIKRLVDEKNEDNEFEHDELTLVVRIFQDFDTIKKMVSEGDPKDMSPSANNQQYENNLDDGQVIPYVDFGDYYKLVESQPEHKKTFDELSNELSTLSQEFKDSLRV